MSEPADSDENHSPPLRHGSLRCEGGFCLCPIDHTRGHCPFRNVCIFNEIYRPARTYQPLNSLSLLLGTVTMADAPYAAEGGRAKRQKMSNDAPDPNPKANPYLAHMYKEESPKEDGNGYNNGYSNGYGGARSKASVTNTGTLDRSMRHKTTAKTAKLAEDGPNNPFNGNLLGKRYFSILNTRRGLPVHAQRYVGLHHLDNLSQH